MVICCTRKLAAPHVISKMIWRKWMDAKNRRRLGRRLIKSSATHMAKEDEGNELSMTKKSAALAGTGMLSAARPVVYLIDREKLTPETAAQLRRVIFLRD